MAYRQYSDAFRSEAVIRLAVNKYDYEKTAEQLGITRKTLRKWDKEYPKKSVPELLERAIERILSVIPSDMSGQDWAVTLGILMDKWLLIHGEPTQRTENIMQTFGELTEDERRAVVEEAQQIVAEFSTSGTFGSNGRGE
jgi:hypothetical protein